MSAIQQGENDRSLEQPSDRSKDYAFAKGSSVPPEAQQVLCNYYDMKIITKNARPLDRPAELWPRAAMQQKKQQQQALDGVVAGPA